MHQHGSLWIDLLRPDPLREASTVAAPTGPHAAADSIRSAARSILEAVYCHAIQLIVPRVPRASDRVEECRGGRMPV